jgi:putative hemolysin
MSGMDAGSTVGLLSVVGLILLNAIVSAAYSALVNARKAQLRELADSGNKRARRVIAISEDATRLLTSRQLVGILVRFTASGLLTLLVAQPMLPSLVNMGLSTEQAQWIVYPVVWVIGALVMMVFGELIPNAFAITRPEQVAILTIGPMTVLINVLAPLTRALMWFSRRMGGAFGGRELTPNYVTEEEIKTLVDAGSEEGAIENEEKEMIYSIFQFGDKVAREVMVPRIDIVSLDADTGLQQALDVVLSEGHSRIPLYEGSIDRICGLLYAKDLLVVWRDNQSKDRKVREIMRPAYFVPESKKAGSLLEELQQRKIHMAIVIDEYGGTAGLVTIEDLVEEIVGEIQDEYDPDEEAEYEKISDDEYLFDASIHIDDVNELLDVHLPDDETDTLGGYVLKVLDKIPLQGESFLDQGLEIKVESITGRRIGKVRVIRLPPPSEEAPQTEVKTPVIESGENAPQTESSNEASTSQASA